MELQNRIEPDFGGSKRGDRQRPSFGEMHMVLAQVLLARVARQLGLGSLFSVDEGDGQRASRLIARSGLEAREKWKRFPSPVAALRPSGPKARICGEDPRCPCETAN